MLPSNQSSNFIIIYLKNQCTLLPCLFLSDETEKNEKTGTRNSSIYMFELELHKPFLVVVSHKTQTLTHAHTHTRTHTCITVNSKIEPEQRGEEEITRIILLYHTLQVFSLLPLFVLFFFLFFYTFSCCSSTSFHKKSTNAQTHTLPNHVIILFESIRYSELILKHTAIIFRYLFPVQLDYIY